MRYIRAYDMPYKDLAMPGAEKIAEMLSTHLPREFLLAVEAKFRAALERATVQGQQAAPGHRSAVTGINRHFVLNEALDEALSELRVAHRPLRGNAIVVGQIGPVAIARFHKNKGPWNNSRRSLGKRGLCLKNAAAEALVQPDFLRHNDSELVELTCFLVTEHDGRPGEPGEIHLVVPDSNMDLKNLLFSEPLGLFLQRYERIVTVPDNAMPTLKPGVVRKASGEDDRE